MDLTIIPPVNPSGYEPPRLTITDLVDRERAAGQPFGPFHRRWLNERAPDRVRRYLELAAQRPDVVATRANSMGMDVNDFPPASFTAVTASATETNLWTPALWTPIPVADMHAGKAYKVSFGGVYTSTATPGTLTWTARAGQSTTPSSNVTLGASGAVAAPASQTGQPWYGEFTLGIRAVDVAFTAITGTGNGFVMVGGTSHVSYPMGGTVATTINNSAATGLIVSLTISVASQSYTCQWATIQSLN